ncbi:LysR family transcriptional regulator [Pectobacterium parmentieri]|uniref:LysR family transcriptional regulator n=1 Tax=Pectobacterium parmentieri TaxID=1905730 RepID=UPI000EABE4A5|nr:LysR family transcriptional regulator [Pectobacterium parmentieri]AYH01809.1 LysR family transcriptional regulator [Pectobacterium parmentieri]AYH28076.1 LysR family transcriptional regulator [Pectobacterium parmentieri]AYH32380.1 LysR family transcriptional regulator [Pectobacterium parmentieri]MBI0470495.1 LysR family transcriptional regulator [Pectobacterium parmentieri]MBI0493095.1 LysR family transcriptional regulator [Pectobacterium parmentieri]
MDIKQLQYLCNLEKERHFGRAAEASFVSQPTLSMRLKNLEKELDLALINRGNNFEGFTAEGERVLAWAREIVSVYQGLKLEVASLKRGVSGVLRIGAVPQSSIALSSLLAAVNKEYPQLDFQISLFSADQLLEALNAYSVDVGIGFFEFSTLQELHFQASPLTEQGVDLLFHPHHFPQLVGDVPLALDALSEVPLCLAEASRYFRRYLDSHFREAGVSPWVKVESASVLQLLQSVYVGLGCGIVPHGSLIPEMTPALALRPLQFPPMRRQPAVVIAQAGRATPLAQNFFDVAQQWLQAQS